MKKHSLLLLAWLPLVAVAAADTPSLVFPEQSLGLPPLSLGGLAKSNPLGALSDARMWFRSQSPSQTPPAAPVKKFVSHMPILPAGTDIDPKMVKVPDSSIDYKLIVKAPAIESEK